VPEPQTIPAPPVAEIEPLLVSIAEVARLLGCSIRTVALLNNTGRIPRPVGLTRRLQWSLRELREWDRAGRSIRTVWETMRKREAGR